MVAVAFKAALRRFRKDQPGTSDVHVDNAGGAGGKRKARLYAQIAARNLKETEKDMAGEIAKFAKVESIDKKLGMVFGFGIICKEDGVDYYDVQDDHIPEDAMLKAAADFAGSDRHHKEMHSGDENAQWLFLFPMTTDIAKAFGMTTRKTGLMMGFKPPPGVLAKFESGEYTGFSIGGERIKDEEVD